MKITKTQLRKVIREAKKHLSEGNEGPDQHMMYIDDVDTGDRYFSNVNTDRGMVTVGFGHSFKVHLSSSDAQELGAAIVEAGMSLEDDEAGRNPGGSIG